MKKLILLFAVCVGLPDVLSLRGADVIIDIEKFAGGQRIPISLAGFSGEIADVLRFDFALAGFEITTPDKAQFNLTGKQNSQLEGRLTDRISQASLLAKAYTGSSPRGQAHALADDVVLALTGRKGIAQTKITFKADFGATSEIYVADYDGHNAQAVTRDNSIVAAPCWFPGRWALYYTSYRAGNPDVYFHNLSSGDRSPIARYSGLNTSAAVSHDGRRVALILSKSGSPDLYISDADGANATQLTKTREDESSPCWSPDGRTICVVSRQGRPGLYLVDAGGGAMRKLATSGVFNATEPDWSPDGQSIAFTTQRGGTSFELCVVPARGGTATPLGVSGEDPSWAPNSRAVVFTSRRGGGRRVLSLLDVPTKQIKDIAPVTGSCSQPSWGK